MSDSVVATARTNVRRSVFAGLAKATPWQARWLGAMVVAVMLATVLAVGGSAAAGAARSKTNSPPGDATRDLELVDEPIAATGQAAAANKAAAGKTTAGRAAAGKAVANKAAVGKAAASQPTAAQAAPAGSGLVVWQADSMLKVFKDDAPPAKPADPITIDAARNEVVSIQVVAWCGGPMTNLVCNVGKITLQGNQAAPSPHGGELAAEPRIRYVGYVGVRSKLPGPTLRPRPCDYPDPLLDSPPETIPARTAQPIWLTLKVPATAAPGLYKATVEVQASVNGITRTASLSVEVKVYAALLADKPTLKVSNWNWFDTPKVTKFCGVDEIYSEPFWKLMEEVAKDMAAHRQNVIFTPVTAWTWLNDDPALAKDLITATAGKNGQLEFDFTLFDRWVTIFRTAGVDGLIEGSQLTKRTHSDHVYRARVWTIENGRAVRSQVAAVSPEYEKYLSVYLPALQEHLKAKGWLDSYAQHVLDEPNGDRKPTYDQVAAWVKKYAPAIRRIDAVQMADFEGSVDIWVPTFNGLCHNWDVYKERQAKGQELWFYTMGRPVEQALSKVRILQWASFAAKTTGYLHWGYNWWVRTTDPLGGRWTLAPGDEWIVYPRKGGVLDSIRYEAMLEGIQDYELLKSLSQRDPKAADAICEKLVKLSPKEHDKYTFDESIETLRAARRMLLEALSEKAK